MILKGWVMAIAIAIVVIIFVGLYACLVAASNTDDQKGCG